MVKRPRFGTSSLPTSYEVGYGKPPAGSRFRKGHSGNPKGRPKGARNQLPEMHEERLKDIVIAEAYRGIKVNDGDRQVSVPMAEAIIRSMALKAAKGDHRSQKLFTEMLKRTEASLKASHGAWLETAIEYKVGWEQELERRRRLGIVAEEPLPHPDDIEIDLKRGTVIMHGPMTKEEQATWRWMAARRDEATEEITCLRKDLESVSDATMRAFIEKQIAFETKLRDRITRLIGIWPNRDPMALHLHRARMKREERKAIAQKR